MPGSILITGSTLRLAEGYVQVNALGKLHVKGLRAAVEAYEVTGAQAVRTRLQAAVTRGLTRFVGRDAEIDDLNTAWQRAVAGRGQIVAVVGEPGLGKSRLIYEFVRSREQESLAYYRKRIRLPRAVNRASSRDRTAQVVFQDPRP